MKKLLTICFQIFLFGCLLFPSSVLAQFPPYQEDSIVYSEDSVPLYYYNQMIIKFHPDLVNKEAVNDTTILSGLVSDFINPVVLQILVDSGYFNQGLGNLTIEKVFPTMTTDDTISITRIGDTVQVPKFWSTFMIYWDESVGMSFNTAIDTFNSLWPAIEYAHPNCIYRLLSVPNDPKFAIDEEQPGLTPMGGISGADINIQPAWEMTTGNPNIKVGIYDTGINWDHDDFSEDGSNSFSKSRMKGGKDFINNSNISSNTTYDDNNLGHGTEVAGVIGAIRNNEIGVAGIAGGDIDGGGGFGVQLFGMKVMKSDGKGSSSTLANAVFEGASSTGFGLNIISFSLGGTIAEETLRNQIKFAYNNKVILVTASGNNGHLSWADPEYPASFDSKWVLKVGASDETGNRWMESNNGSMGGADLDFLAPGVSSLYCSPDANSNSTYNNLEIRATSLAVPHVSGVAALMLSYINFISGVPNKLAPEDVENLLQKFSTDIGATGRDNETGFGRINAGSTLQNMEWPRFQIKHLSKTANFSASTKTKINNSATLILKKSFGNLKSGSYIGEIWEVSQTFDITQPTGRTVLDVWDRNSSSSGLLGQDAMINFDDVNYNVTSFNQTSATIKGYVFNIKYTIIGQDIGDNWIPKSGLNGSGTMAITVYSEDPLASSINNISNYEPSFKLFPNPSKGYFTLQLNLKEKTTMQIEITDLTGRVIYSNMPSIESPGKKDIKIDLKNIDNGVYFCNIITSAYGTISKKIMISN